MSEEREPPDTWRLHLAEPVPAESGPPSSDDTADLGGEFLSDASREPATDDPAERYSEGIIRFYRARTILSRGGDEEICRLAWSYLAPLEPHHLPPVARPAFFTLAYLMYGQAGRDEFDGAQFRTHVHEIATIIDGFLDDLDKLG